MQRITDMLALYREIRADLKKGRARDVGAGAMRTPGRGTRKCRSPPVDFGGGH